MIKKKSRFILCLILSASAALLLTVWVLYGFPLSFALTRTVDSTETSAQTADYTVVPSPTSAAVQGPAVSPASDPTPTTVPTPLPTPSTIPSQTQTPVSTSAPADAPAQVPAASGEIVWYDGYADPRTIAAETVESPGDLTVLVNKYFAIPADYSPDLVPADSSNNQYIRSEADDAWDLMRAACQADTGYVLYLCSGYRTFENQAALYAKSIRDKGIAHACSRNALEGRSEHNLGLALDISTTETGVISSGFAETPAGIWVTAHCSEYGFILRYPSDKTAVTGYVYEPWHYRFVGTDLAAVLSASGQTLEEYYGKVPVVPEGS